MDDPQQVSVTKFVVAALAAALVLNVVLRVVLGLGGVAVTMGVSIAVAAMTAGWFAKSVRRAPTRQERSRFLWVYAGLLAVPFVAVGVMASSTSGPNVPGLFILFLQYIPYPAFAQVCLSEKYFAMWLRK
jgi:O-antigen/teichoic acid export membrane protein